MVVKSALAKNFFREIRDSLSRFLSIVALLALAVAFFSGLRVTEPDMKATVDTYFDNQHLFDIQVLSTLGITQADVDAVAAAAGVEAAAGAYEVDALSVLPDQELILRLHSLTPGINDPVLLEGRLPEAADECVMEASLLELFGVEIGDSIQLSQLAEGYEDALATDRLTIVGTVQSPLYISRLIRGNSTLGNGSVSGVVFLPEAAFTMDYYTGLFARTTGTADLDTYTDAYDEAVEPVLDALEDLGIERSEIRYQELVADAQAEIDQGAADLAEGQAEFDQQMADAQQELSDARAELDQGWADLESGRAQLQQEIASGRAELNQAQETLDASQAELEAGETAYAENLAVLNESLTQIQTNQAALDQQAVDLLGVYGIETAREAITFIQGAMAADPSLLPEGAEQILAAFQSGQAAIDEAQAQYDAGAAQLAEVRAQLDEAQAQITAGQAEIDAGWQDLYAGQAQGERELADAQAQLEEGEAEYETGLQEYEDGRAEGQQELADAQAELDDAQEQLDSLEMGEWYVLGRSANAGYTSYLQDSERMGALANVFPIIFFLVAALVCLTTMTRMVEEKRVEIGTMKALGYGFFATAWKFIGYSLLVTCFGVVIGLSVGTTLLPRVIFTAYSIIYEVGDLIAPISWGYAFASAAAALICTLGATLWACLSSLREPAANLLRPRAPKAGKRVLLERVTPLWRRMSFFSKVTVRNLFRYKKRFFMTLIGIGGCTALILTGFGLRDSINAVIDKQYDEIVTYNLSAYLEEDLTPAQVENLRQDLTEVSGIADYLLMEQQSVDLESDAGVYSGYYSVPEDPERLSQYITLRQRVSGQDVPLTDEGVLITEKISELLDLDVGDSITIVSGDRRLSAPITGIVENYVYHYVYMTPSYYESLFEESFAPTELLLHTTDTDQATLDSVSSQLLGLDGVGYVSFIRNMADQFSETMSSVNAVVYIIIIAASLLALVVLYNLTNINITERTRELATIKVLGFYDGEVTGYVLRENVALTIMGMILGLLCGQGLLVWLVKSVEIDMAMFGRSAEPLSYVYAVILTVVFTLVVNLFAHFRMKKIDMVESLKTIE